MQRQHQEWLHVAAECKRMEETSRGQGYLKAKRPGPDNAGWNASEEADEEEEEEEEEKEEEEEDFSPPNQT